jgi:hypothetical protein
MNIPLSYSHVSEFQLCPRKWAQLKYYKNYEDKKSGAAGDGQKLHAAFDAFLTEGASLPLPYRMYQPMLEAARTAYGEICGEQKLGMTADLRPTDFFSSDVATRVIIDFLAYNPDTGVAVVIDWKTGKKRPDWKQVYICMMALLAHMPEIKRFIAGFYWTREPKGQRSDLEMFTAADVHRLWAERVAPLLERQYAAIDATDFPATPNFLCKKYCPVTSCEYHGIGSAHNA